MKLLLAFSACVAVTAAFQCYTCNNRPEDDDTEPCENVLETCPVGVRSCSSILFQSGDGKIHTRKFCTAPGTPIYRYLANFPGSSICQNIATNDAPPSGPNPPSAAPGDAVVNAPSPPQEMNSNLLCVCTVDACNRGSFSEVMTANLLKNVPKMSDKGEKVFQQVDFDVDE